ncbi:MAG: DUF4923 family protein [Prevotella sp.]|nr:DUF4923 family protein [Prevotella sp.]
MKKNILILATAALIVSSCGFGTMGTTATGSQTTTTAANAGGALGNILTSVLGLDKMSQKNLVGTWTYSQPGCAFTSENLLAKAGGEMAAAEIKSKLQPTFQKVGISSSNTQVTFKQDGTFTAKIAGKSWNGTYTYDESTSKITMTGLLLNINCYAKRNTNGISLLFEASKLLTMLQTMSALSGGGSSTLGTISEISKNYDGLRVGFDMK